MMDRNINICSDYSNKRKKRTDFSELVLLISKLYINFYNCFLLLEINIICKK